MYYTDTFAQGIITTLPDSMARFIDYKSRMFIEMAIIRQLSLKSMESGLAEKLPNPFNWKSFKCYHGMNDETDSVETAANIKLTLNAAGNLFVYGFYSVLLAMLIFLIERYLRSKNKIRKKIKRKRNTRRPKIDPLLINPILTFR